MNKFTPGPWAFTTNNNEPWIGSDTEEGGLICPKPEKEADARLIAKAPVMLENLKYIEYAFSIYELATLDDEEILPINITVKAAKDISKIMLDLC